MVESHVRLLLFCNLFSDPTGSCNFDLHSCGWKDASSSSFRWRLEMANVSSEPGVDHTTSSPFGRFS